jgi:hypothetical protein
MAKVKAEEAKKTFPMLSGSHWWKLREQFKKSIPGVVSDTYLASVLDVQKNSAQANILPALRSIKLIDENGKTQDIAKEWRDDTKYPSVCEKLLKNIYPQELFDTCPNPLSERENVKRWFAHTTGTGESAVLKMVSLFLILVEADPKKTTDAQANKKTERKIPEKAKKKIAEAPLIQKTKIPEESASKDKTSPDVYINLQVHISPDATSDQIEKIFESMAKHIYRNK